MFEGHSSVTYQPTVSLTFLNQGTSTAFSKQIHPLIAQSMNLQPDVLLFLSKYAKTQSHHIYLKLHTLRHRRCPLDWAIREIALGSQYAYVRSRSKLPL